MDQEFSKPIVKDLHYFASSGGGAAWLVAHDYEEAMELIAEAVHKKVKRKRVKEGEEEYYPPLHVYEWDGSRGLADYEDVDEDGVPIRQMLVTRPVDNQIFTIREMVNSRQELKQRFPGGLSIEPAPNERFLSLRNFFRTFEAALDDAVNVPSSEDKPVCVVLKDFDRYLDREGLVDMLRLRKVEYEGTGSLLIILTGNDEMPERLGRCMRKFHLPLPLLSDLEKVVETVLENEETEEGRAEILNGYSITEIAEGLRGLTRQEAMNVTALALSRDKALNPLVVGRMKAEILAKDELMEFCDPDEGLDGIKGCDDLMAYFDELVESFTKKAKAYIGSWPLGCLLVGPSGTGKTEIAKRLGSKANKPTLILRLDKCFSSHIGETNAKLRRMLDTCVALAPVFVVIDEVEKGLGGTESSEKVDAGTTKRFFGTLLSFMSNRKLRDGIYFIMTSNDPSKLPPELFGGHRIDADGKWFVDLPVVEAREQILRHHIDKRRNEVNEYKSDDFEICRIAVDLEGWSGAEIESLAISVLKKAYRSEDQRATTDMFLEVARLTTPASVTHPEKTEQYRQWALSAHIPLAYDPKKHETADKRKRKSRNVRL